MENSTFSSKDNYFQKGFSITINSILALHTYMKEKLDRNGIFFLQETHSTLSCEENWKKESEGNLLFSHGTSNSTGVLIGFTKNFEVYNVQNLNFF